MHFSTTLNKVEEITDEKGIEKIEIMLTYPSITLILCTEDFCNHIELSPTKAEELSSHLLKIVKECKSNDS